MKHTNGENAEAQRAHRLQRQQFGFEHFSIFSTTMLWKQLWWRCGGHSCIHRKAGELPRLAVWIPAQTVVILQLNETWSDSLINDKHGGGRSFLWAKPLQRYTPAALCLWQQSPVCDRLRDVSGIQLMNGNRFGNSFLIMGKTFGLWQGEKATKGHFLEKLHRELMCKKV